MLRRNAILIAVLPLVGILGACDRAPTGPVPGNPNLSSRGLTVGDWTEFGLASTAGRVALDEIAATGANTVVFIVTVWRKR